MGGGTDNESTGRGLRMAFYSILEQGYFVEYSGEATAGSEYQHFFCGSHEVPGAWCPNCNKPLLLFLALDTTDPRLNLKEHPFRILSLFFCWTCNIAQKPLYYQFSVDGSVSLLEYGCGGGEPDFPYEDYPVYFPGAPALLVPIPDVFQTILTLLNMGEIYAYAIHKRHPDLQKPRHQVGGEPFLVQQNPDYEMICPLCKRRMPFWASIGDDCLDPRGFTGNEWVQVIYNYCQRCRVIGAFQQCD